MGKLVLLRNMGVRAAVHFVLQSHEDTERSASDRKKAPGILTCARHVKNKKPD